MRAYVRVCVCVYKIALLVHPCNTTYSILYCDRITVYIKCFGCTDRDGRFSDRTKAALKL